MNANEILSKEKLCIQDEPPYCMAACPVHVDVRSFVNNIQNGKFQEALTIYRKKVFFPRIISRICDEPCKNACIRNRIDDPLSIRLLEKACVDYGDTIPKPQRQSFRKKRNVTVIGGGMSGLCCAMELANKGYNVTLYEKTDRLGGTLWDLDPALLPPEVIIEEMKIVERMSITIKLNTCIENFSQLNYEALYVATGSRGDRYDLNLSQNEKIIYDSTSLQSSHQGIFVGGSLLLVGDQQKNSPIVDVAHGVQAARSIDRYLQGVSLTNGRENEVRRTTNLFTNFEREEKTLSIIPKNGQYTEEEAVQEANRCIKCECMECVKSCDFLNYFSQKPTTYLRDISKTVNAIPGLGKMVATRLINSCSLCGQCAQICPNGLDMGNVCIESRRSLVSVENIPLAFHDFWIRDLSFSNSPEVRLYKNQQGYQKSAYLFFPGCQMGASLPEYIEKSYKYLISNLGGGVGLGLGCCGAPAEWAGRMKLHEEQLQIFITSWEEMGKPLVILSCPTCQKMFTQYLPQIPIQSLWSIVEENKLPQTAIISETVTIAVYDPCSSRYNPEIQESIRRLLIAMGCEIEELLYHGEFAQCCSYGGLISTVNPNLANKITESRISASPLHYVTYCTNCRDDFAEKGKPTWHILDLLFGGADEKLAARIPPSYSKRRENRIHLKETLVKEIWGEDMKRNKEEYEEMKLIYSKELERKIEKEFILMEEIKQVIHYAENTGYKFMDKDRSHFIAHLQIGLITYWVEYLPIDDGYTLYNTYSHRMEIVEEVNKV